MRAKTRALTLRPLPPSGGRGEWRKKPIYNPQIGPPRKQIKVGEKRLDFSNAAEPKEDRERNRADY